MTDHRAPEHDQSTTPNPEVVRALGARLRAAAEAALSDVPEARDDPYDDTADLLDAWTTQTAATRSDGLVWLLLAAAAGRLPTSDEVLALRRTLTSESSPVAAGRLLGHLLAAFADVDPLVEIDVVVGQILVDVDFTARHDHNTGIQRVVRHVLPRWDAAHDIVPVAWNPSGALRHLSAAEHSRVMQWTGTADGTVLTPPARRIIVPWRSTVVLPEVPAKKLCPLLAATGEHSPNRVALIGYDMIPVVSADMVPTVEPERFVSYLTVVKHADQVSAISQTAATEFSGFTAMLPAQGLTGPQVSACLLPVDVPAPAPTVTAAPVEPHVLVVGSHVPQKNHLAVMFAADMLWKEGHHFALTFVGGPAWRSESFARAVKAAQRKGYHVNVPRHAVSDDELMRLYRDARFTMFPSLHEGYGLPVAESLAVGTPAITSNLGSMAEIAADGGALLVDPRDDDSIIDAMRRLLTDDDLVAQLSAQALARPVRTWDDYAADTWNQLVGAAEGALRR